MLFVGKAGGHTVVNRGDPSVVDFNEVEFSKVPTWNDLDLSAIVPVGAVGVFARIECVGNTLDKIVKFRCKGNTNNPNVVHILIDQIDFAYDINVFIFCDSEAFIEYRLSGDFFTTLNFTVTGWII